MKIKFLVAEEIRPEVGGKLTILGLMPDDTLLMTSSRPADAPPEVPNGLERLAFLLSVSDLPEGEHKFKGQIFNPSGEPYNPETSFGEGTVEKGTSRSIIIDIKPFIVKNFGSYRLDFYVDGSVSSFPFEIREQLKS